MSVVEGARVDSGAGEVPARLDGRLKLVLVVLLVAQFMLAVDFSILNVALPVIGDGLGFS
ncbi:MFS transporter, partial [Streptomyces amritsarensis]